MTNNLTYFWILWLIAIGSYFKDMRGGGNFQQMLLHSLVNCRGKLPPLGWHPWMKTAAILVLSQTPVQLPWWRKFSSTVWSLYWTLHLHLKRIALHYIGIWYLFLRTGNEKKFRGINSFWCPWRLLCHSKPSAGTTHFNMVTNWF